MEARLTLIFSFSVVVLLCTGQVKCSAANATSENENHNEMKMTGVPSQKESHMNPEKPMTNGTHDNPTDLRCSQVKINDTEDQRPQVVKVTKLPIYEFSMSPGDTFRELIFRMIINNNWNAQPPYESEDVLILDGRDFKDIPKDQQWIKFHVEQYVHEVRASLFSLGRDKLALRITYGNNKTRLLKTKRWHRTHSYQGLQVSVEGGAAFMFDCVPIYNMAGAPTVSATLARPPQPSNSGGFHRPMVYVTLLILALVAIIIGSALLVYMRSLNRRRHCEDDDQPPPVGELPSKFLNPSKENQYDEENHIYEEFDESTLARLRQNMNPSNLCMGAEAKAEEPGNMKTATPTASLLVQAPPNHYDVPKASLLRSRPTDEGKTSNFYVSLNLSRRQGPSTSRDDPNLSLIEQKMMASPRNSDPEMHGIIRKQSDAEDTTQ